MMPHVYSETTMAESTPKRKRGPYKFSEKKVKGNYNQDNLGMYGCNVTDLGLSANPSQTRSGRESKDAVIDNNSHHAEEHNVIEHQHSSAQTCTSGSVGDDHIPVSYNCSNQVADVKETNILEPTINDNIALNDLNTYLLSDTFNNEPTLNVEPIQEKAEELSDDEIDLTEEDFGLSDSADESGEELNLDDFCTNATENEEMINETEEEQPLYPGSSVTLGAFMLLLAMFFTKNNVVGDGIQQMLNIIALVLPAGHCLSTSLHSYKKFFQNLKNPLKKHLYCKFCLAYINNENTVNCLNPTCQKPFNSNNANYFLEMPVINQVQHLFAQDGFYESLNHRFRRRTNEGYYDDIYDGTLYQTYCHNNGPLTKQENISFLGNTDGAPVFKSSNISIWPLFLVVNELPYKLRMKKENMILAALWFGNKKPLMSTFLKPFLESMKLLYSGVACIVPNLGQVVCKCFFMCVTADLPARSMLCNSNQYNGSYSCWKCVQRGKTARVGKGHTHIFPFDMANPKGPVRSRESYINDATMALELKRAGQKFVSNGVKGPSWLLLLPRFDIIQGVAIDYMHGVLLGVQKLLLRLWFSPEFSKERFSVSKSVGTVDEKLTKIRPTLDITRLPRSIKNDLKYWKASEFRSFLLFYGSIVMSDILDKERFCHYLMFVNALHILLRSGSSNTDIAYAERMLNSFCSQFAYLYHERFMTLNLHQLLHLPDSVRQLGPLYTHSCFAFEDKNGVLLKLIRGSQCIDNQIITGISFIQKLPELKYRCILKGSREDELYLYIENPHSMKRNGKIGDTNFILGSVSKKILNATELAAVSNYNREVPLAETFCVFKRLEMCDNLIYGLRYKRMKKRDNSAICYLDAGLTRFGRVCFFLQLCEGDETEYVAIVESLKCNNYDDKSAILSVQITNLLAVVPVKNIRFGCMFVYTGALNMGYICLFPNRKESD